MPPALGSPNSRIHKILSMISGRQSSNQVFIEECLLNVFQFGKQWKLYECQMVIGTQSLFVFISTALPSLYSTYFVPALFKTVPSENFRIC